MYTDFAIETFDPASERIGLFIRNEARIDELGAFLRTLPKYSHILSKNLHLFDYAHLEYFYSLCNKHEYLYTITEEVEAALLRHKNRPHYIIRLQERRGRILIERNIPRAPTLYVAGISTWAIEHENYSVATSEAYKLPLLLQKYNPNAVFEYAEEVKDILQKESEKRSALLAFANMEDADVPDDISLTLRPFQKVAKKFALTLNGRAILALDMGLGKTPISLSIVEALQDIKKVLIVCPATLKTNWRREIKKCTGEDSNNLSGASPSQLSMASVLMPRHKYHIINYDILGRGTRDKESKLFVSDWAKLLNLASFDMIIFDEAHYTKNMDSGRSKASRELKSRYVLTLTGTPIVNRPAELFPLLNITDPKTFSAYESFCNQWLTSDGKDIRHHAKDAFREMLTSYMFRRRKEDVIKDLPQIQRLDHFIELSTPAQKSYEQALAGIYISLKNPDYQRDINSILAQLTRLKQIVSLDAVDDTVELARDIYEESEKKILIFSQFVESCHDIYSRLGNDSLCITGEDSDESRYAKIDKFQSDPSIRYMVLSTKAGAEGLTLTAAHYIIFNDLCWTPKDHRQAEARCYGRMNDLHSATSYYIQAEGTITEMIMELLRKKMEVIESTVEGVNTTAAEGESIIGEFLKRLRG